MARRARWPLLAALLLSACSPPLSPTTTAAPSTLPPATTSPATSTTGVTLEPPPWQNAPIVEPLPVLAEQWQAADNRLSCAALSPEGGVAGAEPRAANFAGGWAVAWDAPDGPGMAADGSFCADCGRSAIGVAGAGLRADESAIRAWPNVIEYEDGSLVGYGVEGSLGELVIDNAATGSGDSATQLAYLMVAGQDCLYNIWSRRSEAELLDVIGRLRYVEGLGAPAG